MIGIIAAVSQNGVIGLDNKLPFDYSEDLKHFKKTTLNSAIIMGRKTFEGIGKPLPKRRNMVITSSNIPGVECFNSIKAVLQKLDFIGSPPIWLIGGASIYEEGMEYADKIVLTITPDIIEGSKSIRFPWINALKFEVDKIYDLENDSKLKIIEYKKK